MVGSWQDRARMVCGMAHAQVSFSRRINRKSHAIGCSTASRKFRMCACTYYVVLPGEPEGRAARVERSVVECAL